MDAVVQRGAESAVYAKTLEHALFRELRHKGGLSYIANTSYDTHGGASAVIIAVADTRAKRQTEVVDEFVAVVRRLAAGEVEPSDLDSAKAKGEESVVRPDADATRLPGNAMNLLTGYPNRSAESILDDIRAVTAEAVQELAAQALDSALLMVPPGQVMERLGFEAAPTFSRFAVSGSRYRYRQDTEVALVVGAEGVSIVNRHGPATVRFDECAALLSWPDGARQLIGYDGIAVRVEPTMYAMNRKALAVLDSTVDPAVVVAMPARQPDDIPKPSSRARWKARLARLRRSGKLKPLALLTALVVFAFAGWSIAVTQGSQMTDVAGFTMLAMWVAAFACLCVLVWRRRNNGRW